MRFHHRKRAGAPEDVEHCRAVVGGAFVAAQRGHGERRRHKGIAERRLRQGRELGNVIRQGCKAVGFFHGSVSFGHL